MTEAQKDTIRYTFPKEEKLCGEIRTTRLFTEGKAFISYPLRIVYQLTDEISPAHVRVLISVPKKKIKRANGRNHIKRLIREAYRLNKHEFVSFFENRNLYLHLAITYLSQETDDFKKIDAKIKAVLPKILNAFPDK